MGKSLRQELENKLTHELVPEELKELADTLGVDALCKFTQHYGGATIYVPKFDHVVRNIRDDLIKKEFNGFNYKELAKKYNLSESWIRKMCKKENEKC